MPTHVQPVGELSGGGLQPQSAHHTVHQPVALPQVLTQRVAQVVLQTDLRHQRHHT